MKKYLVLIGAAILVMALVSPSMAQFTSWGHMEFQTVWETKRDLGTIGVTTTNSAKENWKQIAERFRFYLQYGDPKTVRAVIGFEADSTNWGEVRSSGTVTGGKMGAYTTDTTQLEIKHAYLDFVVPNTPISASIGLQWFGYGGRLFQSIDAPGVIVSANFAPHKLQAFWWRENDDENKYTYSVNDTYGLNWDMVQKTWNLNAFFAYKNDRYTGQLATLAAAARYIDNPWWGGVGGGFRPGNWNFSGQFVYNGGKRDYELGTTQDKDFQGWIAEASARYQLGPGMFLGLEGFYSTGNDTSKTDKFNIYTYPTSSEARSVFGNDRTVFYFMNASHIGYYHQIQLDPAGMWYGRANFEYSPVAWVRFNLNYMYLGDTSKGTPGTGTINSPVGARTDKDCDYIGQEINLITTFNIYKNFVYNVGVGYFIAGDVYDTATKSADNAWGVNTKMNYAF